MVKNLNNISGSVDKTAWGTPQALFDKCNELYGIFTLDAAADESNAKCKVYFTKEDNALFKDWTGVVWCNPPYGRNTTGAFVSKAYHEVVKGNATRVVMLLPAATDTQWFHKYCVYGLNVFLEGRVKFEGAKDPAPFPSMLTIFAPRELLVYYNDILCTKMKV